MNHDAERRPAPRGRPRRKEAPILVRGTVPENHALAPMLRGSTPARACAFLLELARLQLAQPDDSSSLRLNPAGAGAKSQQDAVSRVEQPEPFDDIRDLLTFDLPSQ